MTINYYLKYTGIPINFGITALLGFLVGTAIAGQTFYNFTIENLKQFGALKAMGATNLRIVGMILLQATVVGLLGYGIGVGLAALFGWRIQGTELAFFTPWQLLPITGRRDRPDLRPVQPAQRAASDPARAGDRLPLRRAGRDVLRSRLFRSGKESSDGHASAPKSMMPSTTSGVGAEAPHAVAVRIRGLTKHFGSGEQRVQALARRRLGRLRRPDDADRRPVGLRQDDAAVGDRRHPRRRRGRGEHLRPASSRR